MARIILLNKPYNVLSQFTDAEGRATLANLISAPGFYPAGRLDRDSEGLLVLTDDGRLQARITHPKHKLAKTYWVQVEGQPSTRSLRQLRGGLRLNDGPTTPARAREIDAPDLWERQPPIRERRRIPTSWLEIQISEGRNRQVRRMTAAIGHPTLRLVRVTVGEWSIGDLLPGQWREAGAPPAASRRQRGRRERQ